MAPQVTGRPHRLLLIPSSPSTMILYLLFLGLILGVVESQTANATTGWLSGADGNQTLSDFTNNSTVKPDNDTSSLHREESHIEDELLNNQTSVITEDDESFQDQEDGFQGRRCDRELLVEYSDQLCAANFHKEMISVGPEKWCLLEHIIRPYNNMTMCLETLSTLVGCYYPNPDIQDFFIQIHSEYFHDCSTDELVPVDAPQGLVIALTLIPVSIIPALVYLVVWKSNVQE